MLEKFKRIALWAVVAAIALAGLYVWRPDLFGSATTDSTIFDTPKGSITLRFDKQGNPTGAVESEEAQRNDVQIAIFFRNGTKKYCWNVCSMDVPVTTIQARYKGRVIATWP